MREPDLKYSHGPEIGHQGISVSLQIGIGGRLPIGMRGRVRRNPQPLRGNRLRSPIGLGELEDLPNLALQTNPRFLTKRTGELDRVLVTIKLVVLEEPTEFIVPFALLRGQRLAFSIESPSLNLTELLVHLAEPRHASAGSIAPTVRTTRRNYGGLEHEMEVARETPAGSRRERRRVWCIMTAGSGTCSAKDVDGWGSYGFAVHPNAAGGPVVSLTYETEAEARAAHALMARVIVGAAITLTRDPQVAFARSEL